MKLKTVKDMEFVKCGRFVSNSLVQHEIKAEAIKWVKKDIEDYRKHLGDVVQGKEINSYTMKLINKWKERLNITGEDLK